MEQKMNDRWNYGEFAPFDSPRVSEELEMLRAQVRMLESLSADYGHKTLDNVLEGLRRRIVCLSE